MGPFEMVVAIVLIGTIGGIINTRHKANRNSDADMANEADIHRMQTDIDRLTERVRVLEKIATDEETQLREQISRLA